ncbi:MBOAT family protein [Thalassospiraceae bacterium LMO-JJ14]|nr:MBOAT family protein [Thalassospiraceae bacterium LMO-JJ14]
MLFNSYTFLFAFLPLTLLGFAVLANIGNARAVMLWLLAMSLVFYAWWNPVYLILLIGSVVVNHGLGRILAQGTRAGVANKPVLIAGIALNLGLIGWFKYLGFFAGIADAVSGAGFGPVEVALPLAISFFTFQQIAYLVDCHKGIAGEGDFFKYALFVTFFPQLIAGPIVHHSEVMGQYERAFSKSLSSRHAAIGLTLIAAGLFKKVVIADHLALYASPVFADADAGMSLGFARAWSGTLAYTLQIYFDFSGYSDMAVGLARLFGVRLPVNFFSPYRTTSIIEFWRRWHMTLSRFLRDYLYVPLGGSRKGAPRRYVNLMVTMLLGGLWHGAGWTFVVWGGLHGLFLIINHGWRHIRKRFGWQGQGTAYRLVAWAVTFFAVALAWVFFRAETFGGAMIMLHGMAGLNDLLPALGIVDGAVIADQDVNFQTARRAWRWIAVALVIAVAMPNIYQLMRRYRPALGVPDKRFKLPGGIRPEWRLTMPWAFGSAVLALVAFLMLTQVSEFLYFRF